MNSWPNALQVQTFAFLFYFDKHLISWIHSNNEIYKIGVRHMLVKP